MVLLEDNLLHSSSHLIYLFLCKGFGNVSTYNWQLLVHFATSFNIVSVIDLLDALGPGCVSKPGQCGPGSVHAGWRV